MMPFCEGLVVEKLNPGSGNPRAWAGWENTFSQVLGTEQRAGKAEQP